MLVGLGPFHREQHRAAPFAADTDALDQADERQKNGAPDADAVVARHKAHAKVAMPVTIRVAIRVALRPIWSP